MSKMENLSEVIELKKVKEFIEDTNEEVEEVLEAEIKERTISEKRLKEIEDKLMQNCKDKTDEMYYIKLFALAMFYYNLTDYKSAIHYLKTCATLHYAPASYYLGKIHTRYNYDESKEFFIQSYKDYHNEEYKNVHKTYDENVHLLRYKFDQINYLTSNLL